jgi:hypothetical protein
MTTGSSNSGTRWMGSSLFGKSQTLVSNAISHVPKSSGSLIQSSSGGPRGAAQNSRFANNLFRSEQDHSDRTSGTPRSESSESRTRFE